MGFWSKKPLNRSDHLALASKAASRGRYKKAIASYREVLKAQPEDPDVLAKMAYALAKSKNAAEAWSTFIKAAGIYKKKGFVAKAVSVYNQAGEFFPDRVDVWESLAGLEMEREIPANAVNALLEGRRRMRRRGQRPGAIALLRKVLSIEKDHVPASRDLARLLAKEGRKNESLVLLEQLAGRINGRDLRRVRRTIFRISPSMGTAWRWLVARR